MESQREGNFTKMNWISNMKIIDLPKTWKRRVQGSGQTVDAFCKELGVSTATFRSKNPTAKTIDKIEMAIQELEAKNHIDFNKKD